MTTFLLMSVLSLCDFNIGDNVGAIHCLKEPQVTYYRSDEIRSMQPTEVILCKSHKNVDNNTRSIPDLCNEDKVIKGCAVKIDGQREFYVLESCGKFKRLSI